ncbi:glycoside hydrolase [Coprinopsis marcescibilis]|uniref:Glycoside hydrolase n=1 Tax=Coprinopsis marcescibilis TaxID=230819 RepID=A0A5C3KX27_COPMA|nr:glycoside hydrolase [Coprinopsis marcescibilis]
MPSLTRLFVTLITLSTVFAKPLRVAEDLVTRQEDDGRKYVVAHHIVGNTFPYTKQDWADDITLAHASGIDGFVLNTGGEVWEPDRIADAYQAALESGLDFSLFLSLDVVVTGCESVEKGQITRQRVLQHIDHPNQLKIGGKAVVSTFGGRDCLFGQANHIDGWRTQFTQHPDLAGRINFLPSLFVDPATYGSYTGVLDGDFNFNGGWPLHVTTAFAQQAHDTNPQSQPENISNPLQRAITSQIGSRDVDAIHINGLQALGSDKLFMGAVSPWFFTHYPQPEFPNLIKNFVYVADQHLYNKRWESLIEFRDQYRIAQILTWNDYGESHYIGPIKGDEPASEPWTANMPHTAWLDLTRYYATAFKTGSFPAIEKDQIFLWSRPHSRDATSPDPLPRPDTFEVLEDAVWAVVFATAPATVILSTTPANTQTFQVPAGLSKLSIPIAPGGIMRGTIQRAGTTVVTLNPSFSFSGSPANYNYNVFVATARAP